MLKTGYTLDAACLRVAVGLHVFHDIIVTGFFREIFVKYAVDRQRVVMGIVTGIDRQFAQGFIDLIVCHADLVLIPDSTCVLNDITVEVTSVFVVVEPVKRSVEIFKAEFSADAGRFALDRNAITKFNTTGKDDIIFAGSDRLGSNIDRHVTGAASFGMVERSLTAHTEPFGDLHIRCQVVGTV